MARTKEAPIPNPGPRGRRCARMYANNPPPPPSSSSSEDEIPSSSDEDFAPQPKRCVRCELLEAQITRLTGDLREEHATTQRLHRTLRLLGNLIAEKDEKIRTLEGAIENLDGELARVTVTWTNPEEEAGRLMAKAASDRALVELQDEKMALADDLAALIEKYHLNE